MQVMTCRLCIRSRLNLALPMITFWMGVALQQTTEWQCLHTLRNRRCNAGLVAKFKVVPSMTMT